LAEKAALKKAGSRITVLIVEFLILLILANGTPVLANKLLGGRFARPLDGGISFLDGQPLFGASKTLRGLVLAIVATTVGGLLLGIGWRIGALVGFASMCGDLFSSFIKRRLKLPPSSRATGLDQIPESLLPLLVCQPFLGLTLTDIVVVVTLFLVGDIVFSPLFYKLRIRKRPY
jgi:CDP-2,3-bis-(O-geranylgeranyl)-sn-glycerol synthase